MNRSLGSVKKEIRILGLDTCNPKVTTGAIVRGGLYLDGVVVFPSNLNAAKLTDEIVETKYFPELRAIMVHDPTTRLGSESTMRKTGLPAIFVDRQIRGKRPMGMRDRPRLLSIRTELDRPSLARVLDLTQRGGFLPEPLRIAHLLAKLHISGTIAHDKG
jgi:endonuclease V-like protein UPF0215 family